jgi:hypothetical protein
VHPDGSGGGLCKAERSLAHIAPYHVAAGFEEASSPHPLLLLAAQHHD